VGAPIATVRHSLCDESDVASLNATEEAVLRGFAAGLSRGEIADCLHMSARTVGNALTTAKEKLGARSLVHAAVIFALYVYSEWAQAGPR
jgi:DNA-binding CsgD family transcriptional regulator